MLNPLANPLYKQVLYDGGQKTNIRTMQNHRNQTVQLQLNYMGNQTGRNKDKITSSETTPGIGYTKSHAPKDHDIFSFDKLKLKLEIPLKYKSRYGQDNQIFPTYASSHNISSAAQIGRFILRDSKGSYSQLPPPQPSETWTNRSHVFLG